MHKRQYFTSMLVPAMTDAEIALQIKAEHDKIYATTLKRLQREYAKERLQLKIDGTRAYTREYTIKTKGKNNWIIFLSKAPSMEKFHPAYVNFCCVVYYYGLKGIKVFNVSPDGYLVMYKGHFFVRYNERLHLNIPHIIDVVKHFYRNNGYMQVATVEKKDGEHLVAVSALGFALGEMQYNDTWIVWSTFISRDLLKPRQSKEEIVLLKDLDDEIKKLLDMEQLDVEDYADNLNKWLAIRGLIKE